MPVPLRPPDRDLARLPDRRRSTREFTDEPLRLDDVAHLLWAGYGHRSDGGRTVPSAHARYALTLTVVAGHVDGLEPGVHRYDPAAHHLHTLRTGDHRAAFADASLVDAGWLTRAAALVLLTADVDAANTAFADQPPVGRRGERYVWLEAGHVGQNLYLAAAGLGLGVTLVAGLDDDRLRDVATRLAGLEEDPLALVAVGPGG